MSGSSTRPSHRGAILVAALAITVAVVASSCVFSGTWTVLAPPNPAPPGNDAELIDVSCPTSDFCLALGLVRSGDVATSTVQTWDGEAWAPVAFEPETGDFGFEVTSVSCGTPTSCAIGWDLVDDSGILQLRQFSVWDGMAWDQPPFPHEYDTYGSEVACAPDGSCVFANDQTPTIVWDGTTFTSFEFDAIAGGVYTPEVTDLSCITADDCVGILADMAVRWNGTTWSDDPWVPLPGVPGPVSYDSIACTATDRCVVVGHREGASVPSPIAAIGDGSNWTAAEVPVAGGSLRAVSCVSAIACVAVGTIRVSGVGDRPLAVGWNGGNWYRIADPSTSAGAAFAAIGCGIGDRCVAVGSDTSGGAAAPLASAYDWHAPN